MAENAPAPAPEPDAGGKGGEQGTKFSKDGDDSLANGPVKKRCCTDIICIPIFIVHVMAFWFLTFQNMSLGNPFKLISPMDFKGDFCGIDSTGQWQGGAKPDLTKYGKMMWSMNVTSSFDSVAKELVCSSYGKMTVVTGVPNVRAVTAANKITEADFNLYCGVVNSYADLANKAAEQAAALKAQADKVAQYTDPAKAASLFMGGGGSGGNPGSQILKQVTKYFVQVCSAGCGLSQAAAQVAGATREYVYSPAPMTLWGKDKTKRAIDLWTKFSAELSRTNDGKETLKKFTFKAWSEAACPYKNPKYCVPMPGVQFEEIGNFGVCMPKIDSGVLKEAGAQAGKALDAISKLSVTEDAKKGFDTAMGDVIATWQVFVIVAFLSLVVGLLVLVLMRFILCPMVWTSLFLVFIIFVAGGLAIIVRSNQCADQSFQDAAAAQKTSATAQASAGNTGDNPFNVECAGGYSIENKDARDWAKIAGYVVLAIAGVWALGVLIMVCRIRLAIAVNQVACQFLYTNPQVLLIPILQNFLGIIWIIVWCWTAAYLLSQVGIDQVPPTLFTTYAEAYGTADVPGKCTNFWPPGGVYIDESNPLCMTPAAGVAPACYKCSAPRFWMDWKFGYSFFAFLWHNFFFVAIGQCTIAGAVGVWFFTKEGEKWKKSTVCVALKNAIWYHTGSLAFGSFILAVVVWLKWFMTWLAQQAKQTKNKVMEIVCKILAYCLWCFEKCVKFLNKNAYIQIALMGTNFCKSAKNAFFLILRNILRFGVIAILSHIVHFIGMILIIALTALMGYGILGAMYPEVNPICPTIIYTFIGWMTAKLFIGTFALAVDATLQCVIAAEEMDCGNEFVPGPLKSFIDENAKEGSKCCDTCCCTIM